jgi:hypothetical protein
MTIRWEQQSFEGLEPKKRSRPKGTSKGNPFAEAVARFLGTERRTLSGSKDKGDLVSRTWTHEVKCPGRGKPLNLSGAMRESKQQAKNAGVELYSVITRRTGYPVAEAFFTIPLWMARELGLDPEWAS